MIAFLDLLTDLAMERSKMPRNCLSDVWYMVLTRLISQIKKYKILPRDATVADDTRYITTKRTQIVQRMT